MAPARRLVPIGLTAAALTLLVVVIVIPTLRARRTWRDGPAAT